VRVVRASLRGGGGQGDVLACFTYSDRWMQGEPYRGPYPIGQKAERVYEIFHRKLIGEKVLVPAGGAAPRHVLTDARVTLFNHSRLPLYFAKFNYSLVATYAIYSLHATISNL